MSDKDLLVVISEMLRKQDQQAEKLDEHSRILNHHTEILNKQIDISNRQTTLIVETNSTLKEFMNISVQQFQQQQEFNGRFLSKLDEIARKP
ncbi:MAG: hypothetical protein ABJA76_14375 [Mucilaginibacter sp.]